VREANATRGEKEKEHESALMRRHHFSFQDGANVAAIVQFHVATNSPTRNATSVAGS
jgi:hypothetical protein